MGGNTIMKFIIQNQVEFNIVEQHQKRIKHMWDRFNNYWNENNGAANEMREFLKYAAGKKCFLDIGANLGVFSFTFSALNLGSRVYAIEPLPDAQEIILAIIDENPNFDISAHQLFFGHTTGKVEGTVDQLGYFNVSSEVEDDDDGNMTSLDAFVAESEIKPDAIKVDVEGYEVNVLMGGLETFRTFRPVLFLETHLEGLSPDFANISTYGHHKGNLCAVIDEIEYEVYNWGSKIGDGQAFLNWMNGRTCQGDRLVCLPK